MLPSNLPRLLADAGLTVVQVDGWRTRHRPGSFTPVGVLNHHTGASAAGWTSAKELEYARWMFLTGRRDLPAPLCQIALGRSGVVYIGAAGRANHAGTARASGSVAAGDGNALYIGVEWMLSGTEKIPAEMMEAAVTLNAVLTEKVTKTSVRTISCHYQTSVTGKWDIGDPDGIPFKGHSVLDVEKFRAAVAKERRRLAEKEPLPVLERIKVALINIPRKLSDEDTRTCWDLTAARGSIFGVNECLSGRQRRIYRDAMKDFPHQLRQFGMAKGPNPIFWRNDMWRKVSGEVHMIHPANTSAKDAKRLPGFYSARYLTELVLSDLAGGYEVAVINTHWVSAARGVDKRWVRRSRRTSKKLARELVRKHRAAGRDVIFMGDTNLRKPFKMPKGFNWLRGLGIDKVGATRPGSAGIYDAPTDHRHGVRATIRLGG